MLLTIHGANLHKVGFIDNEKQLTLNYYSDTWTRNLETASSTFEFTVSKKELLTDNANNKLYQTLNERAFVSFRYKNQDYLFNVMTVEENEHWIKCYCENLNLELINEYSNPYKAVRAMSFVEYLEALEIKQYAKVTVGVNEISDQAKTLEWEGQDTKLARLLSLANKFDAEIEFATTLNDDSSIKAFTLNIYHQADDNHTGVGRIRSDIQLTYGRDVNSITRKVDKTEIYTLVVPYGRPKETAEGEEDRKIYIDGLKPEWEEKDSNGIVRFRQSGWALYAPHAASLYPSTFGSGTQNDQWIRKDLEVDSDNPTVIRAAGIANIRKNAYPAISYEVDGYIDLDIGDTVVIHDEGFTPTLDVRSRVVEQKISFSDPTQNKTTFGNFKELENRTSGDLRAALERMVENSRPYVLSFSTDNGTIFKNGTGQSTIRPTLKRGNQTVNATYRFVINGNIVYSGLTYTMQANKVSGPTVVTVSAWVDNQEVASDELTFVGVADGRDGRDGRDGVAGKAGVGIKSTAISYGLSDGEVGQPGVWTSQPPTLIKGKWLWTRTIWTYTDSTTETGYQKTYISKDGNDGKNGIAGKDGVGIRTTTIVYASHTSGTTPPQNGWTSQVPAVLPGQYLWTKTTWTYTDNTTETGYSVAKAGENGQKGTDGRTQYTHIAYADTISGSGFSQTDQSKAFIGMYQDFTAQDSRNPADYRWTKWKGTDGRDGVPGKAGADGKTPYIHFAYADSADGRTGFSLTQTGNKRYFGHYADYEKPDSNDPTKYKWVDTTSNVSEGGENLIRNSANPQNLDFWGVWEVADNTKGGNNPALANATHGFYFNSAKKLFRLNNNRKETGQSAAAARFKVKRNTQYSVNISLFGTGNLKGVTIYFLGRKSNETNKTFTKVINLKTINGSPSTTGVVKWHLTFNSADCDEGFVRIDNNGTTNDNVSMLFFADLDCYEGTLDRVWQRSPLDTQAEIESKADAGLTQDQLNRLSEINSLVQAELEAKASIETVSQWMKAYQDFVTANKESQARAEQALEDASARVVKLETNLGDMAQRWNFIDSYMASTNEGLTIGKSDGTSSMLFSPDGRISMYSAGNEVMYISKGVINIQNGIFSKTIQIGRYREEQDYINPDRNVIRYVGGES